MKTARFLQAAVLASTISIIAVSCAPSRPYSYYPDQRRSSYSLIIDGSGISASRYDDGRYYYRDDRGYTYWRGNDNRYYLDRQYLGNVHYDRREYNDWKRYDRDGDRNDRRRRH